MRPVILSLVTACAFCACAAQGQTVSKSPDAGPGQRLLSPYDAGVIFADTCLIRGPNFEDAEEGVRVHNVTQNSETGTYYHNAANLSVKVANGQCSLVFATDKQVDDTVFQLAQGTVSMVYPVPAGVDVTSRVEADGLRYFRIAIKAPVAAP